MIARACARGLPSGCLLATLATLASRSPTGRMSAPTERSQLQLNHSVATVAWQAADAMCKGRAHVEPSFLSDEELETARADILNVLGQVMAGEKFESIQTDLLNRDFQRSLPFPLPFAGLLERLDELRHALAQSTGRSLLEGGGLHLMFYPISSEGDKFSFMRHVDEDAALYEPVRNSISFLLYLTPRDWAVEDGGALCVYEDGEGTPPRQVLPVGGTLVIYDSSLEHEVLPTRRARHLLSGRFREVDEHWQARWRTRPTPSVPL